MPRNASGVYSKPAGTAAFPITPITSSQFNNTIDDIAADLNAARPVTAGGTGATSEETARDSLGVALKVASASDFTVGRGITVGTGGLLGNSLTTGVTNFNDILTGFAWNVDDTAAMTNAPSNVSAGVLLIFRRSADRVVQMFVQASPSLTTDIWFRTLTGAGWTAWARVSAARDASPYPGVANNFNNMILPGDWSIDDLSLVTNGPAAIPTGAGLLEVKRRSATRVKQVFTLISAGGGEAMYQRVLNGVGWTAWRSI